MVDLTGPSYDAMIEAGLKVAVTAFNRAVTMYLTLKGNTFETRDELCVLIAAHAAPAPDPLLTTAAAPPNLFG